MDSNLQPNDDPYAVSLDREQQSNTRFRRGDSDPWMVGWLVVLRIYVALAVFQPYREWEAGDNQSLKFKWRDLESNPEPLAPQAKSLTTTPPPLPPTLGQLHHTNRTYICTYRVIVLTPNVNPNKYKDQKKIAG